MPAVPVRPSLVAITLALPVDIAVTKPAELTVATNVGLLLQETGRLSSTVPSAPCCTTAIARVAPAANSMVAGVTVTLATGTAVTVIALVPLFPSLVAVMVAEPVPTARTSPPDDTVATFRLLDVHATERPFKSPPVASRMIAVSACVPPTSRPAAAGVTVTLATGAADTVTWADPSWPSLLAVMVVEPGAMPRTTPVEVTVAAAPLEEDHDVVRPVSTLPDASRADAENVRVAPTTTEAEAGETTTCATGAAAAVTVTLA